MKVTHYIFQGQLTDDWLRHVDAKNQYNSVLSVLSWRQQRERTVYR